MEHEKTRVRLAVVLTTRTAGILFALFYALAFSDQSVMNAVCCVVMTSAEAIDIDNLDVPQNNPSSFRSLPTRWQIPLSSLEIVCCKGEPVELGRGGFGLVYR